VCAVVRAAAVVCYYGVGKPTERAYVYKTADGQVGPPP
jgi:hypothetical protein